MGVGIGRFSVVYGGFIGVGFVFVIGGYVVVGGGIGRGVGGVFVCVVIWVCG